MDNSTQNPERVTMIAPQRGGKFLVLGLLFPLILGGAFVASAYIVANTFLGIKKLDNIIAVSGSAKQRVTSDSARWTGTFSRLVTKEGVKDGYAQMKEDEQAVRTFLDTQGFPNAEISPISMNEWFRNDSKGTRDYNLAQYVEVKSNDIEKIKALAKNSESLARSGIFFSPAPVEYYYSKLPELRVSLLPAALKDARDRANAIAQNTGATVGAAKTVSMGVVQVLSADSVDVSDYGSYDTSKIDKDVMITVKATFQLK